MTTSSTASSSTANLPSISYIINILNADASTDASVSIADKLKVMKDLTDLIKAVLNRPECKWNENFQKILHCLMKHLDAAPTTNENSPEMVHISKI